jgi:hypothetical protein
MFLATLLRCAIHYEEMSSLADAASAAMSRHEAARRSVQRKTLHGLRRLPKAGRPNAASTASRRRYCSGAQRCPCAVGSQSSTAWTETTNGSEAPANGSRCAVYCPGGLGCLLSLRLPWARPSAATTPPEETKGTPARLPPLLLPAPQLVGIGQIRR